MAARDAPTAPPNFPRMSLQRVATIGVYGFDADSFFAALVANGVDLFCDLRARRGVRGRECAFANARRLEAMRKEGFRECGSLENPGSVTQLVSNRQPAELRSSERDLTDVAVSSPTKHDTARAAPARTSQNVSTSSAPT